MSGDGKAVASVGGAVTYDHFERTVTMLMERQDSMHADLVKAISESVAAGVVQGHIALAKNDEAAKAYWGAAYIQLSQHTRDEVSKSVGKRVMTWAAGVLLALALYVAVKAGLIK